MKTEEQIKQRAEQYADGFIADAIFKRYLRDTYIVGARSRDKEIEELQNELESLRKGFYERGDKLKELMLKNNELRNPWISVKDRLPKDGDIVLTRSVTIIEGGGERNESVQHLEQKYIGRWITDTMEQHRMGGILFDTIVKVTHWMPIPELTKGE